MAANANSIKKLRNMVINAYSEMYKIANMIIEKYTKETKEYFEYIAETAVDDFYAGYSPNLYERQGDLKNAYKVVVNKNEWAIYFGPEFMKNQHHQSNEIVYNVAFEYGYHGGSGITVNDVKAPWWRTPHPWYPEWLGPAQGEGISPKEAILELYNTYMDNIEKKMQAELDTALEQLFLPILRQVEFIYGGR